MVTNRFLYFPLRTLKPAFFLCFLSLMSMNLMGQEGDYYSDLEALEVQKVHWVDQIPSKNEASKKNKKGWLKRFLFGGSDIPELLKPVLAIPTSQEEIIILDHGNGTIFILEDGELDIPKIIKKQNGKFTSMVSGCLLPNNDLLFTDSRLNEIYRLSADRKRISVFNESPLEQPTGIAFCPVTNKLWVVETASHRVSMFDLEGKRIRSFGERGDGEYEFNYPTSVCVDKEGKVYVVDTLNYRIQIFNQNGVFVSQFGENGNGTGYLASPKGIAIDSHGFIYLVDALFHGVQIFDIKGNYLYQFGQQGREAGEFWMPSGIFIDENDKIYVADGYNARIQQFELDLEK